MANSPQTYIATKPFTCAGATFAEGDAVTGVALYAALPFGEQFVTLARKTKAAQASTTTTTAIQATTEGA